MGHCPAYPGNAVKDREAYAVVLGIFYKQSEVKREALIMPPHCDTMDGPVAKAAKRAQEEENVAINLPYVPKTGEEKDVR